MQFTYLFFLDHIMVEEHLGPLFCCIQAPHMSIAPHKCILINPHNFLGLSHVIISIWNVDKRELFVFLHRKSVNQETVAKIIINCRILYQATCTQQCLVLQQGITLKTIKTSQDDLILFLRAWLDFFKRLDLSEVGTSGCGSTLWGFWW